MSVQMSNDAGAVRTDGWDIMDANDKQEQAAGLLQQLGLKEYEAKCFVALTRLPKGSARKISEITDVPRTRVYDAIRVLEAQGLVEIQHTNPRQYRAVPLAEAAETLRRQYEDRVDNLEEMLGDIESVDGEDEDADAEHEVWSLTGRDAITSRTTQLLTEADDEIVVVFGRTKLSDGTVFEELHSASDRGVDVIVGVLDAELEAEVSEQLPDADVFVSELDWLHGSGFTDGSGAAEEATSIENLLLVDRNTILLSSVNESSNTSTAVFGRGFENGLVVLTRRLFATGLLTSQDPSK